LETTESEQLRKVQVMLL